MNNPNFSTWRIISINLIVFGLLIGLKLVFSYQLENDLNYFRESATQNGQGVNFIIPIATTLAIVAGTIHSTIMISIMGLAVGFGMSMYFLSQRLKSLENELKEIKEKLNV